MQAFHVKGARYLTLILAEDMASARRLYAAHRRQTHDVSEEAVELVRAVAISWLPDGACFSTLVHAVTTTTVESKERP